MYPARLTGGPGPSGTKGTGIREHGLRATRNGEMKKIKKFLKGLGTVVLCIMWLIMLPIIWLYDRIFGDWK